MKLDKATVALIFESATDQADYIIGMYKLVFPQWDDIEKIHGWPAVNDKTSTALFRLAMDADSRGLSKGCLVGGAWMNNGFGSSGKCGDWEVDMSSVRLEMKHKEPAMVGKTSSDRADWEDDKTDCPGF